jgi:hypothetical protein
MPDHRVPSCMPMPMPTTHSLQRCCKTPRMRDGIAPLQICCRLGVSHCPPLIAASPSFARPACACHLSDLLLISRPDSCRAVSRALWLWMISTCCLVYRYVGTLQHACLGKPSRDMSLSDNSGLALNRPRVDGTRALACGMFVTKTWCRGQVTLGA